MILTCNRDLRPCYSRRAVRSCHRPVVRVFSVEAGDFDFSAFERKPTEEETEQFYAAGEAGELGPEWKSDGIGCDIAIVVTLLGVGTLFGCHWWWGASVVSISIDLLLFALLVAVGPHTHFRVIPESSGDGVSLV